MQQLPDDDSTRILSIVHSLPREKGSANKGCIWREGDGVYWSRDNGRDETSTALRGKAGRGGNLFQTRYFADRDIPDMGLGLLPGSHYCLGPRDRLYKSKVRFCACRPK
eukprot:g20759.t1